jgi:hypothetical protein
MSPHVELVRGRDEIAEEDVETVAFRAPFSMAYVDAEGRVHAGEDTFELVEAPLEHESAIVSFGSSFDYDDDGRYELFVQVDSRGWESGDRDRYLLSFSSGSVGTYPPADGIDVEETIDYDGDGRVDLVSILRFWAFSECGEDPPLEGTPPVLYHSLPDGTFSASDAVAARYLREQCPVRPAGLIGQVEECGTGAILERVSCARIWGATAEELAARLRTEWDEVPADQRAYTSLEPLIEWAAIDPPQTLSE